jgi:hypothetical protein
MQPFPGTATMPGNQENPRVRTSRAVPGVRTFPAAGPRRAAGRLAAAALAAAVVVSALMPAPASVRAAEHQALLERLAAKTQLEQVAVADGEGRRVRLTYYAPVAADIFWRFKTDFQNNWLVSNEYIEEHRFIGRNGNIVITETKYTYGPDVFFRWKTELIPAARTLRYTLLNPADCDQDFNYGVITLEPDGAYTRVTHTSHFDFTGAFIWAHLPGPWGMVDFFRYTARWEQETILRLEARYAK